MNTVLDFAEKAGIENLKERAKNGELIHKEASSLLTLFLSGAGAALFFAANQGPLSGVFLLVSFWLFGVALILTLKCLMYGNYPAVWNEPKNLNQEGYELDQIRIFELENIQERIGMATELNFTKSSWLNKCILLAGVTPIIALISWLVLVAYPCFFA